MQKIVIIGASSAIAEHCARLWARQPVSLVLVGRELARVQRVADDLRVRSPQSRVQALQADLSDATALAGLAARIVADGRIDIVLIAHGNLPDQAACERDLVVAQQALLVNGVSPALCAEAFTGAMQASGGTIAVIGSVAGDRGRKSNYAYGAAKGLVDRYVQGMQHRFARGPLKLVLVKPGPTATPMTAHLPPRGLAPVEAVAQRIVDGIAAGHPVVYAPPKWWLIMMVIRHLPRFVFNRMDI